MSNNTIRIRTTPLGDDKYLKVNLDQEFDFLEVLSLKLSQEDVYREFCSDYGVIAGRITINRGFGIPNARVSIFIPLDNEDKFNPVKKGIYPYENLNDKDSNNIRYNVLPKESEAENPCFTPVGTFPTKREVLDNDVMLEVYCKYYKFTTTTNHAGDFMIFGVPLGNYTVHLDADISDIGIASQRPYDMISKGASISRFDSTTKFSSGTNLDKLVQIKSLDSGVNVQPFWGDIESYEIGITRLDLDLNYDITPAAIFMGSIYGDKDKHSVNKRCAPRKKLGLLEEQMTNEGTIRMIRKTFNGKTEEFNVDGGEVIDEDGGPLNPLMGHYIWKITAKRYDYSFEAGFPDEDNNVQVYDNAFSGVLSSSITLLDQLYLANENGDYMITQNDELIELQDVFATQLSSNPKTYPFDVDQYSKDNIFDNSVNDTSIYGTYY